MFRASIAAVLFALAAAGCGGASGGAGAVASPAPTLPITTGDYPAYGHAPDFSWVAGRLIRSAPAGQCTYVIFSTHRGEPWGGRIALASTAGVADLFPNGDMVVISGSLEPAPLTVCDHPALAVRTIEEH